ncbi:MAG: exosortase/archaeosortase family protein [Verrucomicrobia bacterium]|nr:exosortase/archaeosortase family protein [Verrucomicrobiota bacterium]MCF7708266.1 exosortase/archaeosortase family protein [Verrucomicrobiota bacterium]
MKRRVMVLWLNRYARLAPAFLVMTWLVTRLAWFWNNRPELSFGWLTPVLALILVHDKLSVAPEENSGSLIGSVCVVAGCLMLLLVQAFQAAYGSNSASTLGLAMGAILIVTANVAYVYGIRNGMELIVGFGFILVAVPLPSLIHNTVILGLKSVVTWINIELLNFVGIPAESAGSTIVLPGATVGVEGACSGIRSIQSAVMASLFLAMLSLKGNMLRVLLIAVGLAAAFLGNVLRSFFLTMIANSHGEAAIERYHDPAGWTVFGFVAVLVGLAAWFLAGMENGKTAAGDEIG